MVFTGPQTNNQCNNGIIGNGSNNTVNTGNNNQFVNNQFHFPPVNDAGEDELDRLLRGSVSKDAFHNHANSPPKCHPGTRKTVCNEIEGWIGDSTPTKSPLLWLNGPAAVGKSVIAKTIAMSHKHVIATFFFSTSSDKSATTLFPTLAWQLARRFPETKQHMIDSLTKDGSLLTSEIEEQFDLLIVQPSRKCKIASASLHVMIIDGVDECTDEGMLVRFLQVLVCAGKRGDMPLRFIICSRPEPRIHAILGKVHNVNPITDGPGQEPQLHSLLHRVFHLLSSFEFLGYVPVQQSQVSTTPMQDVWKLYWPIQLDVGLDGVLSSSDTHGEQPDVLDRIYRHPVISTIQIGFSEECKEDIARYLTDKFNAIHQQREGTSSWFQPCDISDLVEASCGQFLYASTIVRLLDDPHFHPRGILKMARGGSLPTPDLNRLYRFILKRAQDTIRNNAQEGGPDYQRELGFLMDSLTILVFCAENVRFFTVRKSFPLIECLLGVESGELTQKLCNMHSVLNIIPGESVQVHHRSFIEFLRCWERSREYHIAPTSGLRRVLNLMIRAEARINITYFCGQLQ